MHLLMCHLASVLQGLQAKLFQLHAMLGVILEKRDQRRHIVGGDEHASISFPDARPKAGGIARKHWNSLGICIENNSRLLVRDGGNHQRVVFTNQREEWSTIRDGSKN